MPLSIRQEKSIKHPQDAQICLWNGVTVLICPKTRITFFLKEATVHWKRSVMIFLRRLLNTAADSWEKPLNHLGSFLSNNSLKSRIYGTSNVLKFHNSNTHLSKTQRRHSWFSCLIQLNFKSTKWKNLECISNLKQQSYDNYNYCNFKHQYWNIQLHNTVISKPMIKNFAQELLS